MFHNFIKSKKEFNEINGLFEMTLDQLTVMLTVYQTNDRSLQKFVLKSDEIRCFIVFN